MTTDTNDHVQLARRACSHLERRWQQVQAGGERFEPFDYRPFLDLLTDDAIFAAPAAPGTPVYGAEFRGKPAIEKLFLDDDPHLVDSDALRVEVRPDYFSNGSNRVIVLTAYSYVIRKTGTVAHHKDIALVLEFDAGRIRRATEIQDLSEWAEAYPRSSR